MKEGFDSTLFTLGLIYSWFENNDSISVIILYQEISLFVFAKSVCFKELDFANKISIEK